jgi:hypothetical protein
VRKFAIVNITIFISILLAGLYGIIHDQITYTICSEYFTKFKYEQFGFEPAWFGGDRQTVVVIGFLATWWTGLLIGLVLGVTALIFRNYRTMWNAVKKSIVVVFCFAIAAGIVGFFYGKLILTRTGVDWWLPNNLVDRNAFITVGSIHNFSYLGGLLGLIAGVCYLIILKKKQNRRLGENTNKFSELTSI